MATFQARPMAAICLGLLFGLAGCRSLSPPAGSQAAAERPRLPARERAVLVAVTDPATGQPVAGQSIGGFYGDRIEVTAASRFVAQQTDASGKAELPLDLGRKPVIDAGGTRASLDVKKLRAGQTQVIQTGQTCACCNGEQHAARPLRVEVTCK